MVEINNQRKAFLDMLAWSEGIQRTLKPEIMVMTSLYRRAIYWLLRSPSQTCHAKPKTQINRRRTSTSFFPVADAYRKQLGLKDFSPKSQDAVALQQIGWAQALYHDCGDIRQAIDRCSNIWASLPGAGYGQFEHKAGQPDCKIQRSGRNGQRDWCMSRVTAIISALVICIIVICLSWAVNHYR